MGKIYNFGAGPAKLPEEVSHQIIYEILKTLRSIGKYLIFIVNGFLQVYDILKDELTNFDGTGISLLETSHRSQTYFKLNKEVQDVVRRLM